MATEQALQSIAQCMADTPGDHPEAKELHAKAAKLRKQDPRFVALVDSFDGDVKAAVDWMNEYTDAPALRQRCEEAESKSAAIKSALIATHMSTTNEATRYDRHKAELTRRQLSEHPGALPSTVARHYASLATTAMALGELARVPGENAKALVRDIMDRIALQHREDFGCDPTWLTDRPLA